MRARDDVISSDTYVHCAWTERVVIHWGCVKCVRVRWGMGQAKGAGVGVSPTRLVQYLYVFAYIHTFTHSHIVDTARTPRFLAFLVVFVQGRKGLRVTVSRGGRSRNLRRGKEPEPAKGKEPHNRTKHTST